MSSPDNAVVPTLDPDGARPSSTRRLVVNPHLRVIRCSDDEVLIKHGGRSTFSEVLYDEHRSKLLGPVLERLAAPATLAELQADGLVPDGYETVVADLLEHLHDERILIEPEDDLALAYVETILDRGDGAAARLSSRRLAVLGAGGLGERVARNLIALRPAALLLVDDAPAPAATRLGDDAVQAHPASLLDDRAMREVIDSVDFAVVALDAPSPRTLHAVNAAAIAIERPWMPACFDGSEGLVGPICVPGESPCYLEVEMQREAAVGIRDDYMLYREALDAEPRRDGHVLPAYLDTVGGMAASAALRFLLSGRSFAVGRVVRIDFERMSIDGEEILRLPRCPACVTLHPAYQHEFL